MRPTESCCPSWFAEAVGLPVHFDPGSATRRGPYVRTLSEALRSDVAIVAGGVSVGEKDRSRPVPPKVRSGDCAAGGLRSGPGKPFLVWPAWS